MGDHKDHNVHNDHEDGADDPEARARQICLRLLTLTPRTRAQLSDALRKRGIPDTVAAGVLDRYTDVGLIDDAAFARAWVESRHYSRGLAGRAEFFDGIADLAGINAALLQLGGQRPAAEVSTARKLVAQRLAGTRGEPAQARTRRLAGMLARKGYPPALAFRVIREALEAEGADAALEEEPYFDDPDIYTE